MSTGFKPVSFRYDDALTRVSWDAFEHLIADYYRAQGFEVDHVGTGGGPRRTDGGIDLILRQGLETIVVQCKHWNCWKVPHNDVHQLIGVMHTAAATGAVVITSGEFTNAAIEAAAKFRHIRLIDGKAVRAMLGPIEEPAVPFASFDAMPSWSAPRHPPKRAGRSRAPIVAVAAAFLTMAVSLCVLWQYYAMTVLKARTDAVRATQGAMRVLAAQAIATRHVGAMPGMPVESSPASTMNGHAAMPAHLPTTKAEIAAWEAANAESMRILEKTTPSVP